MSTDQEKNGNPIQHLSERMNMISNSLNDLTSYVFEKEDFFKKTQVHFFLRLGLYLLILLIFFFEKLTSETAVYVMIVLSIFGFVLFKFYKFMHTYQKQLHCMSSFDQNSMAEAAKHIKSAAKDILSNPHQLTHWFTKGNERVYESDELKTLSLNVIIRNLSDTRLHLNEIIEEALSALFDRNRLHFTIASSVCIAIGLLGTFFGIFHAIEENLNAAKLVAALNEAIGSSLVGVLTAIFILWYSKLNATLESDLKSRIEQFTMLGLFPNFQSKTDITIDDRAAELIGKKIGETISASIGDTFTSLTNSIGRLEDKVEKLNENLTGHTKMLESLVKDLTDLIGRWDTLIQDFNKGFISMEASLVELTKEMENSKLSIKAANDELNIIMQNLVKGSQKLISDFKAWSKMQHLDEIRQNIEIMRTSSDKLSEAVRSMDDTIKRHMANFIEKSAEHWLPMQQSMAQHQVDMGNYIQGLGDMKRNFEQFVKETQKLGSKLAEISDRMIAEDRQRMISKEKKIFAQISKNINKNNSEWLVDFTQDRVVMQRKKL